MAARSSWNIGFDARLAGPRHAGIGRYSEELLKRLLKLSAKASAGRNVQWYVFVNPDHELTWLDRWVEKKVVTVVTTSVRHYSLAEQVAWPWSLRQYPLDILHVPHFNVPVLYAKPLLVTIHDLLWHQERDARATTLPASIHWLKHMAYRMVSAQATLRARAVFVPTKSVAKDVQRLVGRSDQVYVTPEGIPESFQDLEVLSSRNAKEPFIVYTGSLYPHKNMAVVLKALRRLPDLQLKIVGARSVFVDRTRIQAERIGVAHQIEWCGRLPDKEVIALYQKAVALVQPSRAEGFGLTGLEALAAGCPIVVSDIPVFREVYQQHATFFLPHDPVQLAKILAQHSSEPPSTRERLAGQQFARTYSWDKMAEQTWHVYRSQLEAITTRT